MRAMRTIGVVTVGRSDYGILLPILRRIEAEPELALHLIVSGAHLAPEFGRTVAAIEQDGLAIGDRVTMLLSGDTPEAVAISLGLGTIGFAQALARRRPDLLLVVGDRFEVLAAVSAALPFNIPVAHVHGGEVTAGAFDDALRHAITKLSHLHFVAMEEYARRVIQMGEEPWRVIVSGAPALDYLQSTPLLEAYTLEAQLGLCLTPPPLLVTYHPVTREPDQTAWQINELLEALKASGLPAIVTAPNADPARSMIASRLAAFATQAPRAWFVPNLGTPVYFSLMARAAAMVGNSSSGIIEAPSLGLPVVNIGTRQHGRVRASNVIDVGYDRQAILEGIRRAVQPEFRDRLKGCLNPYGHGQASDLIVQRLKTIPLDARLTNKRFIDATLAPVSELAAARS